ncbi:MAG TPA: hypothetical protein VJA26_12330 [Gammaproteobacteria bacterium]|nr:hypothetical protein [Gammaproteobacteria bacterium]
MTARVIALGEDQVSQLRQLCQREIDRADASRVDAIDAKTVAQRVAARLNARKPAHALLYCASVEGIAQIARDALRGRHDPPDGEATAEQLDAFGSRLNERYSLMRPGWERPQYVRREAIPKTEFSAKVLPMLKKRSEAYARHYDLAKAWNDDR